MRVRTRHAALLAALTLALAACDGESSTPAPAPTLAPAPVPPAAPSEPETDEEAVSATPPVTSDESGQIDMDSLGAALQGSRPADDPLPFPLPDSVQFLYVMDGEGDPEVRETMWMHTLADGAVPREVCEAVRAAAVAAGYTPIVVFDCSVGRPLGMYEGPGGNLSLVLDPTGIEMNGETMPVLTVGLSPAR